MALHDVYVRQLRTGGRAFLNVNDEIWGALEVWIPLLDDHTVLVFDPRDGLTLHLVECDNETTKAHYIETLDPACVVLSAYDLYRTVKKDN
jgi:hypothetical protein